MIDLRLASYLDPTVGLPSLPEGAVDVVITDPPFDARTHRAALEGEKRPRGHRTVSAPLPFPPLDPEAIRAAAGLLVRVAQRWLVVFAAERQIETWAAALESAGARCIRFGIALRTNPRPQFSGDRPAPPADHIVIAHAGQGRMRWNGGGKAAKWASPQARFDPGGKIHPTQKPLDLMRGLVSDFTDPGELILDPFAGSGTTAVACKRLGRRFLGYEINPSYHAAAVDRIEATHQQTAMPALLGGNQ